MEALSGSDIDIRAMLRDASKLNVDSQRVEVFQGNLDDSASVAKAVKDVDKVFLCTPMDACILERECRVIDAAARAGVKHIVKIYGSVKHGEDPLITQHKGSIDALKASGMGWTLVSPNSVMESSVLSFKDFVIEENAFFGMSGHGKIGMVALRDIAHIAAHVLTGEGHSGQNYELTGPKAVDMFEVADIFTQVLGRDIKYVDMPEVEFAAMMKQITGMPDDALERAIICHLRCWREGMADLHTDTFYQLAGKQPTSLETWAAEHRAAFCA